MPQTSETTIRQRANSWVYASLTVIDGERKLKPAQVGPNFVLFRQPPHLTSAEIEIILTNGEGLQQHMATVLPHDADATEIPIRLAPPHITR